MPTCIRCGAWSPDSATLCEKCGVAFGSQLRAQAGRNRNQAGNYVRMVVWVVALICIAAAAPSAYHAGNGFYQKFHLDSVTANAMKSCGGPVTDSMAPYQRDQVNDCLSKDEDFTKAKQDFAAYTDSEKGQTKKGSSK